MRSLFHSWRYTQAICPVNNDGQDLGNQAFLMTQRPQVDTYLTKAATQLINAQTFITSFQPIRPLN